jgi:SWI/SNF-related matrix-associated actin-dependent regulator of chromatin subfamily A member 5
MVCLERFGYGTEDVYDRIKEEIKKSTLFRFDWFIKSRTSLVSLKRSFGYLIMCAYVLPSI